MSDAFKPNAELGSVVDPLISRYFEASAIENAQPSASVRANVLARAQTIAQANAAVSTRRAQSNVTPLRKQDTKRWWQIGSANDARWQWSAAAALIAVGVTGWLNYQWTNPNSWQPESPSTTVASAPASMPAAAAAPVPTQSVSIATEPAKPAVATRESMVTDSIASVASAKKLAEAPSSTPQTQLAQAPTEAKVKAQSLSAKAGDKERSQIATQSMEASVAKSETSDRRRETAREANAAAAPTEPSVAAAPARPSVSAAPSAPAPAPMAALALPLPAPAAPAAASVASAAPAKPETTFNAMRDEPTVAMADSQKRALRGAGPSGKVAAASPPAPPMAVSVAGAGADTAAAAPTTATPTRQVTDAFGRASSSTQAKTRSNATESLTDAIRSGIIANIRDAIAQGGDVNAHMDDGTPLIVYAAKRGDVGAVEQLLLAKARGNVTDASGKTALDYARARGDVRMIDYISKSTDK
jgi:hypothetical protein